MRTFGAHRTRTERIELVGAVIAGKKRAQKKN